ncbi:hypothetical protein N7445_002810 [Penicillium cf. griseofulvum]|nr:hypothetical protein N7445_002810 [Penicillium cf. griseofulvum]
MFAVISLDMRLYAPALPSLHPIFNSQSSLHIFITLTITLTLTTNVINAQATSIAPPPLGQAEAPAVSFPSSNSTTASVNIKAKTPFSSIQALFDHLHTHPGDATKLNATYPHRGVIRTAALHKTESDQKFTILEFY